MITSLLMNRVKFTFTEDSDDAGFDTIQDLVSTWKSDSVLDTPNCMSRASTYTALLGTNDEFERSAAERCSDEHEVSVDNDEFSLDTCCPQLRLKVKVCEAENNSVQNDSEAHEANVTDHSCGNSLQSPGDSTYDWITSWDESMDDFSQGLSIDDKNCTFSTLMDSSSHDDTDISTKRHESMTKGSNIVPKVPNVTYSDLQRHFHMPIAQAAKSLGVGMTYMKRRCRHFNIKRWPHRKLKSMENLIKNVQTYAKAKNCTDIEIKLCIGELEVRMSNY